MKITILYNDKNGCDYHRSFMPFRYLDSVDGDFFNFVANAPQLKWSDFRDTEILYFNRHPPYPLLAIEQMREKYGFKIWCDVDDMWELYPHHYLTKSWKEERIGERIQYSIKMADIVTCPNSRLAWAAGKLNSNVEVVPNALPMDYEQFISNKHESEYIRFMFAGGASHLNDYGSIGVFMRMIIENQEFEKRTKFILAGYNPSHKESVWEKIREMMKGLPRFETRPEMPLNAYMEHYNYTDISIAPLEINDFNTYKSNLKIIEAGAMKCPIIATRIDPYLEDENVKSGVVLCVRPSEYYEQAKFYLKNPSLVIDRGNQLNDYVKENYDLVKVNKKRRQILNYLMSK